MLENNPIKAWPEWKIEKQLGEGTYGAVYQVVRTEYNFENRAAVKVIDIPPHASELNSLYSEGLTLDGTRTYLREIMDDFIGEIRLMETLKGTQNIVGIEDYKVLEKEDSVGWEIYIRMELLTPLQNCICSGAMSETQVIQLGREICAALMLCASKGIIHRDIKPENIFINDFGHFKLGDFGVARKLEGMTSGLSRRGTPNYMAPEVAKGEPYDARADIYSLGLVLYRLLNKNRLPFLDTDKQLLSPGERRKALERRLGGEALPLPSEASPALGGVILKACAHDPNARFASAEDLDRALACLDTQPLAGTAGEAYTYQQPASISMTEPLVYSAPAIPPVPAGTGPAPKKIRWGVIVPVFCAAILSISLGAFFLAGSLANRAHGHRDSTSDDITSIGAAKDPADGFGGGGLADPNSSFGGGSLTGPDSSFGGGSLTGPDSSFGGGSLTGPDNSFGGGSAFNIFEIDPVGEIGTESEIWFSMEKSDGQPNKSVQYDAVYNDCVYLWQPEIGGFKVGAADSTNFDSEPDVVSVTLNTECEWLLGMEVGFLFGPNGEGGSGLADPLQNGMTFGISTGTYVMELRNDLYTYLGTVTFDHSGRYTIKLSDPLSDPGSNRVAAPPLNGGTLDEDDISFFPELLFAPPESSNGQVRLIPGSGKYSDFVYVREPGTETGQAHCVYNHTSIGFISYDTTDWFDVVSVTLDTEDPCILGARISVCTEPDEGLYLTQPFHDGMSFEISAGTYFLEFEVSTEDPYVFNAYSTTVTFDHNGSYTLNPNVGRPET